MPDHEALPAATFEMLLVVSELTSDALFRLSTTILPLSVTEASLSDAMTESGDINTKFSVSATR